MARSARRVSGHGAAALVLFLGLIAPSCGGGGGASGGGGGMTLLSFSLDGIDNAPINRRLVLEFSAAIDPVSVGPGSIQIREGPTYGQTVAGEFLVEGSRVSFLPELPAACDLDASGYRGLHPDTRYTVTVAGGPEALCVRAAGGHKTLPATRTLDFHTCPATDPGVLEDMVPGQAPAVVSMSHANGDVAAPVHDGNELHITFSECLDPCSIDEGTIRFRIHQFGDPLTRIGVADGRASGFDPPEDNNPHPYDWGSVAPTTVLSNPYRIPAQIELVQDYERTEVVVTPIGGRFPENALVVVELLPGIRDFGGTPLVSRTIAFTTENLPAQRRPCTLDFEGETPIDARVTNADVDTKRSPSCAQGWFVFSGDGDNGASPTMPAGPFPCLGQVNDGVLDDFDPATDVVFDTGASSNCPNAVDGSRAVVWEFDSFRLRAGVRLRFIGANPAMLLVRGDVTIEAGATMLVRGGRLGDKEPVSDGERWKWAKQGAPLPVTSLGGVGVAGGGNGGSSVCGPTNYGDDAVAGFGSPDAGLRGGEGAGLGGVALYKGNEPTNGGCAGAGGGGGHARQGVDGLTASSPWADFKGPTRSQGGADYWAGPDRNRMLRPSAGSGGGGGGWLDHYIAGTGNGPSGGGGGAGGGYLALVTAGIMRVDGTIDASGGEGGRAMGIWSGMQYLARGGGGGGGAGGGILLMSSQEIILSSTAVVTTAGGLGGQTGTAQPPPPYNHGGDGSNGRLVMEDADGIAQGAQAATLVPSEGNAGFHRGVFDASRFLAGRRCEAVSRPFYAGGFRPTFEVPAAADFLAGVPVATAPPEGATAMVVEIRGHPLLPDGGYDEAQASPWYTVGYFETTHDPDAPRWVADAEPPDVPRRPDNDGVGILALNVPGGMSYLQIRVTFLLGDQAEGIDPGAWIDRWRIWFTEDF